MWFKYQQGKWARLSGILKPQIYITTILPFQFSLLFQSDR